MLASNNVNDNVKRDLINIDNDNGSFNKAEAVEQTAKQLVDKFDNPDGRQFYCKVAYKLPEHLIWNLYEASLKGRNPRNLFSWLAKREITRRGPR